MHGGIERLVHGLKKWLKLRHKIFSGELLERSAIGRVFVSGKEFPS